MSPVWGEGDEASTTLSLLNLFRPENVDVDAEIAAAKIGLSEASNDLTLLFPTLKIKLKIFDMYQLSFGLLLAALAMIASTLAREGAA